MLLIILILDLSLRRNTHYTWKEIFIWLPSIIMTEETKTPEVETPEVATEETKAE